MSSSPPSAHVTHVTTPAERRRAFGILFVSLCCMGAGQTVLFNILPPLSRQLHLSEVQTTSVFAVSAAIWVVSATFWGKRSDRWGRKPILLLGLISFAVSFALFASVMLGGLKNWIPAFLVFPLMILARSLYGALGSGTSPSAQAYVADRTTPQERLQGMATVGSAFGLGTAIGPAIASVFTPFGLLAPFYFISGLALASAATIFFLLPERTPPARFERPVATIKWHDPRILPFVIFALTLSTASTVPVQTMGFFFIDMLHLPASQQPYYISVGQVASSAAALFAQFVVIRVVKISSRAMTTVGLAAALTCCIVFLFTRSFPVLVIALAAQGLGFGLARPGFTTGASLSVAPHEQGAVAGVIGGASAFGFVGGPFIGWLYEQSPYVPYVFGGLLLIGLVVYQWLSPTLRSAGVIPPDVEIVEEDVETPVANA
ncbi:MAG TPA: MFS transporter [Rhizomicrobium sp.]|jgi:MFS family permease|nr:MFS transporter [Rhizomicrobium sp.]